MYIEYTPKRIHAQWLITWVISFENRFLEKELNSSVQEERCSAEETEPESYLKGKHNLGLAQLCTSFLLLVHYILS